MTFLKQKRRLKLSAFLTAAKDYMSHIFIHKHKINVSKLTNK